MKGTLKNLPHALEHLNGQEGELTETKGASGELTLFNIKPGSTAAYINPETQFSPA